MYAKKSIFILLCLMLIWEEAVAWQLVSNKEAGNIILHDEGYTSNYANIIGEKEGFDRRFVTLNGSPALQVSGRDEFYYTLSVRGGEVFIDCAYVNARNIYNGARVSAGICGLHTLLDETYDEIGPSYSNQWQESIFSFDTKAVFETGEAEDFPVGGIGGVRVFDRYLSISSLENSSPQKIIKSASGCFNFRDAVVFLVFVKGRMNELEYLDVFHSGEPMRFQRMQEADLVKLAVGGCA
jgi:hypothetical protein